ncbi:hypothetical protein KC367_g1 [Hortaea werneckii]|nr:hypothetical protein KC367_g1 [Hortaea werneckii]
MTPPKHNRQRIPPPLSHPQPNSHKPKHHQRLEGFREDRPRKEEQTNAAKHDGGEDPTFVGTGEVGFLDAQDEEAEDGGEVEEVRGDAVEGGEGGEVAEGDVEGGRGGGRGGGGGETDGAEEGGDVVFPAGAVDEAAGGEGDGLAESDSDSVGAVDDVGGEDEDIGEVGEEVGNDDHRQRGMNNPWKVLARSFHLADDIIRIIPAIESPETSIERNSPLRSRGRSPLEPIRMPPRRRQTLCIITPPRHGHHNPQSRNRQKPHKLQKHEQIARPCAQLGTHTIQPRDDQEAQNRHPFVNPLPGPGFVPHRAPESPNDILPENNRDNGRTARSWPGRPGLAAPVQASRPEMSQIISEAAGEPALEVTEAGEEKMPEPMMRPMTRERPGRDVLLRRYLVVPPPGAEEESGKRVGLKSKALEMERRRRVCGSRADRWGRRGRSRGRVGRYGRRKRERRVRGCRGADGGRKWGVGIVAGPFREGGWRASLTLERLSIGVKKTDGPFRVIRQIVTLVCLSRTLPPAHEGSEGEVPIVPRHRSFYYITRMILVERYILLLDSTKKYSHAQESDINTYAMYGEVKGGKCMEGALERRVRKDGEQPTSLAIRLSISNSCVVVYKTPFVLRDEEVLPSTLSIHTRNTQPPGPLPLYISFHNPQHNLKRRKGENKKEKKISNPPNLPPPTRPHPPTHRLPNPNRPHGNRNQKGKTPPERDLREEPEIEIVPEEGDASHIRRGGDEDGDEHDPMPGGDFAGDHEEFGGEEGGVGEGDHMHDAGTGGGVRGIAGGRGGGPGGARG